MLRPRTPPGSHRAETRPTAFQIRTLSFADWVSEQEFSLQRLRRMGRLAHATSGNLTETPVHRGKTLCTWSSISPNLPNRRCSVRMEPPTPPPARCVGSPPLPGRSSTSPTRRFSPPWNLKIDGERHRYQLLKVASSAQLDVHSEVIEELAAEGAIGIDFRHTEPAPSPLSGY